MLKPALFALALCGFAAQAHATSLQDFERQSPAEQGRFIFTYIKALAATKEPPLGQAIVSYFEDAPSAQEPPPGVADLMVQIMAVDRLAKEGKTDRAKIQIEGMITYVVRQHFKG